ncbi:MAG: hypothetical protein ABIR64_03745 [Candidatus Limnocylindrales bacterium]
MIRRATTIGAGSVWLATLGLGLATVWVSFGTDFLSRSVNAAGVPQTPEFLATLLAFSVAALLFTVGYATVGALLAGRAGAGRIGWIMLAGGFLFALVPFGYEVGGYLTDLDPRSPLFSAAFLLGPVAYALAYAAILPGVAIAFPDGRLPSSRWRLPVTASVAILAVSTVVVLIQPGPIAGGPATGPVNPFGVPLVPQWLIVATQIAAPLALLVMTALGLLAVATRYRRGNPVERQQLRWFLAAVSLAALPLVLSFLPVPGLPPTMILIAAFGLALVPVSVGVAVSRYRLYEIDHLINRTLVYVPLTALLAGLYAGTVTLLQRVFQSTTGDKSDAAIIISTLVLASVFTPVRKWLEGIVDRRFKPAAHATTDDPTKSEPIGDEWDARMTTVALRVVRAELDARAVPIAAVADSAKGVP